MMIKVVYVMVIMNHGITIDGPSHISYENAKACVMQADVLQKQYIKTKTSQSPELYFVCIPKFDNVK